MRSDYRENSTGFRALVKQLTAKRFGVFQFHTITLSQEDLYAHVWAHGYMGGCNTFLLYKLTL